MSEAMIETGSLGIILTRARLFIWGFISQAASSATNFGLSLLGGVALGPTGLGMVFVGFSYYLLAIGFQRALITDPLVAGSSTLKQESRADATRAALTMAFLLSAISTAVLMVAGLIVGGEIGRGLILFVPWIAPALVQDFWRVILFRDGRGRAAAANDLLWAMVMAVTVPFALVSDSAVLVVAIWGAGGLAGMTAGFFQARVRPDSVKRSFEWWRRESWPLGRWLGAESIAWGVGSHGLVFVLAALLTTRSLGGLRAAQTLFAPLSLLATALALPGLPELSRRVAESAKRARRLAILLGAVAGVLTGGYVLLASFGGRRLLGFVFGEGFGAFSSLLWPVAVGQLLTSSTVGFGLLLKAQGRGRALLWSRIATSVTTFGLASVMAARNGVEGAAWGMAAGFAVNAVLVSVLAFIHPTDPGVGIKEPVDVRG